MPTGLGPCPMMKEGQVFYADYAKPDGFCDEAWKAVYQYVFALAHGARNSTFYYGDWIKILSQNKSKCGIMIWGDKDERKEELSGMDNLG